MGLLDKEASENDWFSEAKSLLTQQGLRRTNQVGHPWKFRAADGRREEI
jgi:hypothetical protein